MERVIRNATTNRDANVRARTFKPVLAVVAFTRTVEQLRVKDMIIRFYESAFFCVKLNAAKSCCVCGNVVVVVVVVNFICFVFPPPPPLFAKKKARKKRAHKIIFTTTKKIVQTKVQKVSPHVLKRKGLSSILRVRPLSYMSSIYITIEKNKRKRGHLMMMMMMMRSHQTISLVIVFGNFSNPPNIPLDLNDCPLSPAEIFDGSMMTCLMFARRHVYVT